MKIINFFSCLVIVTANLVVQNVLAESSVWKVSKGEDYFYLGGTIHMLNETDHPLPEEFSKAYKDADEVFFETDLLATQTPEFQAKFMAAMAYTDERTLASELEPEVYRKLEKFMSERQIPIENFSKFQPWGVSLILSMLEYQRLGMVPEHGVDLYFNKLAVTDKKDIVGLETPEEQLSFLSSMKEIEPNKNINYTLRDLERLPEFIEVMKKAWRSGDIEEFSENELMIQMKTDFPEVYEVILLKRNAEWMKKIPAFIEDEDKELLLVGAMHLNGEEGLLNQLEVQGFKVEQLSLQ